MKTTLLSVNTISSANRFDASYHLSDGVHSRQVVRQSPYKIITVGDASQKIFHAGRWKRTYVSVAQNGVPLVGSSDMLKSDLTTLKRISRKFTPDFADKKLEKGWILISCSGTIGNSVFTTKEHAEKLASQDVIRIIPNDILRSGYVYAFLSSSYGFNLLTQGTFGAVIQHIEPANVSSIPIPVMPESFQQRIDDNIQKASTLREVAADLIAQAERRMKEAAGLEELTVDDYDYFGPRNDRRNSAINAVNIRDIGTTSFNAFCHSSRIQTVRERVNNSVSIKDILQNNAPFSTGSFPRVEVKEGKGVMLINQSDIFDTIVKGKWISKRKVNLDNNLVSYGEVLVAGVGTLGENETFCRAIFANEDLVGQLVSGEFIRMKCNDKVPSGYLYTWLNSDYGFRLIRATHSGTKLCRPIPRLFLEIPVPIIDRDKMDEIDLMVRTAFTKRHEAYNLEKEAIRLVEAEIDKWNKN